MMQSIRVTGPELYPQLTRIFESMGWATIQRFSQLEPWEIRGAGLRSGTTSLGVRSSGLPTAVFNTLRTSCGLTAYGLDARRWPATLQRNQVSTERYRFRITFCGELCYQMGGEVGMTRGPCCTLLLQEAGDTLDTYVPGDSHLRYLTLQCDAEVLRSAIKVEPWELRAMLRDNGGASHGGRLVTLPLSRRVLEAAEDLMDYRGTGSWAPQFRDLKALEIVLRMLDQVTAARSPKGDGCVEEIRARLGADPAERVDSRRLTLDLGINRNALQARFKRATGQTMSEYRDELRWTQALERLAAGELSIKQIALRAGFRHAANFSTAFRRRFGFSPSAGRSGRLP